MDVPGDATGASAGAPGSEAQPLRVRALAPVHDPARANPVARNRRNARAAHRPRARRPDPAASSGHAGGYRRRGAAFARDDPAPLPLSQGLRGRAPLRRPRPRHRLQEGAGRTRHGGYRQRRGHRRFRDHPHEPACGRRRRAHHRRIRGWLRIGGNRRRRAARARPRRAQGEQDTGRPAGRHAALDIRLGRRRRSHRRGISVRHRPVGIFGRGVGAAPRLPFARRRVAGQPHSVRRGRESRQFGRPAASRPTAKSSASSPPFSIRPNSMCSSGSALPCRSRTQPRPMAFRLSDAELTEAFPA